MMRPVVVAAASHTTQLAWKHAASQRRRYVPIHSMVNLNLLSLWPQHPVQITAGGRRTFAGTAKRRKRRKSNSSSSSNSNAEFRPPDGKNGSAEDKRNRKGKRRRGRGASSPASSSSNVMITDTQSSIATSVSQSRREHELRVAAVQARALARRQQQQQQSPLTVASPTVAAQEATDDGTTTRTFFPRVPSQPASSTLGPKMIPPPTADEQNTLVSSIQHWLTKDTAFFLATMEALDLKLMQIVSTKGTDGHGGNPHGTSSSPLGDFAQQLHQHPIQGVWDQYRQLYYESIPEFRDQLMETVQAQANKGDDNNNINKDTDESLLHGLDLLNQAGFSDPSWSRRFRQVRGYRLQLDGLTRHVTKQQKEVQRRRSELNKEQQFLRELEEMEKLSTSKSPSSSSSSSSEEEDGSHRKKKGAKSKKRIKAWNERSAEEPKVESLPAPSSSFLQQVLGAVSWFWSPKVTKTPPIIDPKNDRTDQVDQDNSSISASMQPPTATVQPTKLQKRIRRKQLAVKELQDKFNEATLKLDEVIETKNNMQVPMQDDEYQAGHEVVARVRDAICTAFARHIQNRHAHLIAQYQTLETKTDLTKPHEWYDYARLDRRKIIFHGGPTNSGKTFSALERLKEAKNGLYLGPLRLLAAEVYETLTADGYYTNLYTGQERREIAFWTHASATVEMCSFEKEYDVVVIDEIQMIADTTRGAAWTKAILGLRCKEIHVCGGLEAREIVEKLARACGDEFEVKKYERFSKLQVSGKSLARDPTHKGAYSHVRPGDCVVAFSRNDIFAIKREIESTTDHKCCVIYGKLPPETRADQARRFNDPDSGYEILVASDAIGMGLNLNIKRIVFNSIFKFNGDKIVRLSHSEIKQISGRAGRRNSPYPNGEVGCRDPRDLPYIRECLSTEIEPIQKAAILPTAAHIELFHDAIQAYNLKEHETFDLHQILRQFSAMATVKGHFFLGRQTELRMIAKRLKHIPLSLQDAYTMCLSPTNEHSLTLLENFAWKFARSEASGLPSRPVPKRAKSFDDLSHLCGIYADADLFLWLQFKFPPSNAVEQAAALARKEQTLEYINAALANTDKLRLNHCYLQQATRHRSMWEAVHGPSENVGPNFENLYEEEEGESYLDDSDEEAEAAC